MFYVLCLSLLTLKKHYRIISLGKGGIIKKVRWGYPQQTSESIRPSPDQSQENYKMKIRLLLGLVVAMATACVMFAGTVSAMDNAQANSAIVTNAASLANVNIEAMMTVATLWATTNPASVAGQHNEEAIVKNATANNVFAANAAVSGNSNVATANIQANAANTKVDHDVISPQNVGANNRAAEGSPGGNVAAQVNQV
jgi:cytochrome c biogenesis factor